MSRPIASDAINIHAQQNFVETVRLNGRRFDCGIIHEYVEAIFHCFQNGKNELRNFFIKFLAIISRRFGLHYYNQAALWWRDQDFNLVWKKFPGSNGTPQPRRYNLYYLTKMVEKLEGSTAECGALRGGGSYLICAALSDRNTHHYIFDSFAGLSQPKKSDVNELSHIKWRKGDLASSESELKANLKIYDDRISVYPGWIPNEFHKVCDKLFKLVHIDVDLEKPTYDSLAFFYPRMVSGGIIILDDYAVDTCPGVQKAVDEFFATKAENPVKLASGGGFVVINGTVQK